MKKCIVIQGPTQWLNEIKKSYQNCEWDIIYSTWEEDKNKYNIGETAIFNKKPKENGIGNLFYQQITTLNGLKYAEKNNYEYAIKMRSDMIPTNQKKFLDLFNKNMHFFYWHNHDGGYIVDYFMGGKIKEMIKLWQIDEKKTYKYSEQAITKTFKDNIYKNENYDFIGKLITKENDVFWLKNNLYLSTYSKDKLFLDNIKNEI